MKWNLLLLFCLKCSMFLIGTQLIKFCYDFWRQVYSILIGSLIAKCGIFSQGILSTKHFSLYVSCHNSHSYISCLCRKTLKPGNISHLSYLFIKWKLYKIIVVNIENDVFLWMRVCVVDVVLRNVCNKQITERASSSRVHDMLIVVHVKINVHCDI